MPVITDQEFTYDPLDYDVQEDPYPYYKVLRDRYPVYHNEGRDFWTLSRFEDVRNASRDFDSFSNSRGVELDQLDSQTYVRTFGPGMVLHYDPPDHTRIRKVVNKTFSPRSIQALEGKIREIVGQLLDELEAEPMPDLAESFAWRLPVTTICHVLGFPREDARRIQGWIYDLEAREQGGLDELPVLAQNAAAELAAYIQDSIVARRRQPRDDFVSLLVEAEKTGELQEDDSRGMTFITIHAGIDTTGCLVSNALYRFADRPDDRALLVQTPELVPNAVEEIVRYEAPVQGLVRVAARDVTVGDHTIPAGAKVWLSHAAANRDERKFPNPDVLDIHRDGQRNLGFGDGIHHCLGKQLARLEGRIAFEEFFRRFPNYVLVEPDRWQRLHQHTTRGWVHLYADLNGGVRI